MTAAGATADPERRAALEGAKLASLVTASFGPADRQRHTFGSGAALTEVRDDSTVAYVLVGAPRARMLGPALVWAHRAGATALHVLAESEAGVLARRAAEFADPPTIWQVDGTELTPAAPSSLERAEPEPAPELVDLLLDAGLELVVEGGIVRAEVLGLEVARIVSGPEGPQLEVGVGKADRELTAMVHGDLPPIDQLHRVTEIVREHRRAGAARHPLNQLVPERWLRARLCLSPERVGLSRLVPVDAGLARPNLSERWVAPAQGVTAAGETVTIVCSVGIDLDLVPSAADARLALEASGRLLLAVPERDDHPATRRLAARLRSPAEVLTVAGDWRA